MLKEHIEVLLRDNAILKRAVAIQYDRQKENDEKSQEVQHVKQLLAQYQEQIRTLEVSLAHGGFGLLGTVYKYLD